MALPSLGEHRGYDWAGTEPALLLHQGDLQGMVSLNDVCRASVKIAACKARHVGAWEHCTSGVCCSPAWVSARAKRTPLSSSSSSENEVMLVLAGDGLSWQWLLDAPRWHLTGIKVTLTSACWSGRGCMFPSGGSNKLLGETGLGTCFPRPVCEQ